MKRRALSFLLAFILLLSLMPTAFAYEANEERAAQHLYDFKLFRGKGTDINGDPIFALDEPVRRDEAITMVVRLMGEERNALNAHFAHPFTDAGWATQYVGFAYQYGVTMGISDTLFGSSNYVTMDQFLTLVLRAMGYADVDWKNPYRTANRIGLSYPTVDGQFDRGNMVVICNEVLHSRINGTETLLLETLYDKKALYQKPIPLEVLPTIPADGRMTVTTKEELNAAMAAYGLAGRMDWLILTVPSGQRDSYVDYIRSNAAKFIPDAIEINMMYREDTPDVIWFSIIYHDSARIRGYLRGLTDTLEDTDRKTLEAAQAVVKKIINDSMTDYEKVLAIHEYVLECTTYGFCDMYTTSFEAAGPLLYGAGVCDGYSCAFQLLCNLAGIECIRFNGEVSTGAHSWNQVLLDGQWYHVDCTWDDTGTVYEGAKYEYFLLGDTSMDKKGHNWDRVIGQNKCPSDYES